MGLHPLPKSLSIGQYEAVYNALSMCIAAMGASTVYFFLHSAWVGAKYKTAVTVSGIVTLIAFYHYFRIFNSWVEAYKVECSTNSEDVYNCLVTASGQPFNDAYRYMDWLLTVPLLLMELILVMKLSPTDTLTNCVKLGFAAGLMIILGYPGELQTENKQRWIFWVLAMIPFLYIIFTLFVGLKEAVQRQDSEVRGLVSMARVVTIVSWLTYPFVFMIPMFSKSSKVVHPNVEVGIQIGYSISDIISKCGVGIMITRIAIISSKVNKLGAWRGDRDDDALITN